MATLKITPPHHAAVTVGDTLHTLSTQAISGVAASVTQVGHVELATGAETNTGTSATLAVTPDGLDDWTGSAQVVTVGALASGSLAAGFTDVPVAQGGTGASTAQAAIDALSAVSGATSEHVLTKDTATGNAIFKAAAGGGGTSIADADADTKVQVEEGADEDKVRMDVAGTERFVLQNTSPHLTFTGDQYITGNVSIGAAVSALMALQVKPTVAVGGGGFKFVSSGGLATAAGNDTLVTFLAGSGMHKPDGETTGHYMYGLDFQPTFSGLAIGTNETATATEVTGMRAQPQAIAMYTAGSGKQLDVTTMWAGRFKCVATLMEFGGTGDVEVALAYGVDVEAPSGTAGKIIDYTALRVRDTSSPSGTINLLEVGPATPYLRCMGNFTAAANETPVYISEGATPTLRQLKTKDGAAIGGGDLVCVLV